MSRFERSIELDCPVERLFAFHLDTRNAAAIAAYGKTGFIPQEPPRQLYPVVTPDVIYMAYRIGG